MQSLHDEYALPPAGLAQPLPIAFLGIEDHFRSAMLHGAYGVTAALLIVLP